MIGRREFPHQLPPLTLVSGRGSSVRVRAIRGSLCLPHIVLSSGSFKFPRHRPTPHAPSQNEWLFVAEVGRHCITRAEKLLGTYFGSWAKSWYKDTYAAVKEYHTAHAARCDEECPQKETESRAIPSIWILPILSMSIQVKGRFGAGCRTARRFDVSDPGIRTQVRNLFLSRCAVMLPSIA